MMLEFLVKLHAGVFDTLFRLTKDWFAGLAARLIFASVLLVYFANSAGTKVGSGFPGLFTVKIGGYAQILPPIAEAAGYDPEKIAFLPWGLLVYLGTLSEFLLPVLILIGLFTRLASLAMIGFIATMTYVDIVFHGADAKTIGGFFDRIPDSAISDQRLLWLFPLIYLVLYGAGRISCDGLLSRRFSRAR